MTGSRSTESPWLYFLAGALMVGGPIWRYLYVNHYPFSSPEAVVLPLAAALVGGGVAVLGQRAGGILSSLIFGGILFAFVDLQFDLEKWFFTAFVAAGCLVLSHVFRSKRAVLTSIILGTFYVTSLPRPRPDWVVTQQKDTEQRDKSLPLLVHIILDEQWGIGGMRAEGDSMTAEFVRNFYFERGFEVYEGAYSRWRYTTESIPQTVSLGQRPRFSPGATTKPYQRSLEVNPYFQHLQHRGYAVQVFQSTFMDFCHSVDEPVLSCEVASGNSISNIGFQPGSWLVRGLIAGRYFLNLSSHVYAVLHPDRHVWRVSMTGGALAATEHMRKTIMARPGNGTAIFAHLLLPHRPVEVDAQCMTNTNPSRRYEWGGQRGDSNWSEVMALYAQQVRCTQQAIGRVIAALDSTVGRDGSIVIIHGDHGSRLGVNIDSLGASQFDVHQLNLVFSTLLAIRRPHVPAAIHTKAVPVQDFLWELIRNDFTGESHGFWFNDIRADPTLENPSDTLRSLGAAEMLWARPDR